MELSIFIVAGESSADIAGAMLIKRLKEHAKKLNLFGVGGTNLKNESMVWRMPSEKLNAFGTVEWMNRIFEILKIYRSILKELKSNKPDLAILIDLPDFNLRLAKKIHAMKIPIVYYIPPQVWVWRKSRIKKIKKYIDLVLVVLPFEKEFYLKHGVDVKFVGHPALDRIKRKCFYRTPEEISKSPRIAILPGSRQTEIEQHIPIIKNLLTIAQKEYPNSKFILPLANTIPSEIIVSELGQNVVQYSNDPFSAMEWADLAVVASGTATLEMALSGTPFCAFYKVGNFSWWIFKHIINYKGFLTLPNIICKKEVIKEFFQENANAENIFLEIKRLISDPPYRQQMINSFEIIKQSFGISDAALQAKNEIINFLKNRGYVFS